MPYTHQCRSLPSALSGSSEEGLCRAPMNLCRAAVAYMGHGWASRSRVCSSGAIILAGHPRAWALIERAGRA